MHIPTPFKNFLSLLKFGIIYQALYFCTIPIIIGKYSAESFGIFTIIFSIASVIGAISALRVERAIVVENLNKIKSILIHVLVYITTLSFVSAFIIFITLKSFNVEESEKIILVSFGAIYCFLFGLVQVLTHISIREGKVKLTGVSDVIFSGLLVILLLTLKVDDYSEELLLLIIFTTARFLSLIPYQRLNISSYFKNGKHEDISFKELYKYYFPVVTTLLSNIQFKGIFYLTGIHYGGAITGNLSMTQRIVYAPVNLIGSSLRKSFFLEFTRNENDFQIVNGYINKVLKYGSISSIIIFPLFLIVATKIQPYIPSEWDQIPTFGIALYPAASILVLLSWLDRVYDAKKKQSSALFYEVIYTSVLYTALLIALSYETSSIHLILIFTGITVFYNLSWAYLTLKLIKSNGDSLLYLIASHLIMLPTIIIFLK